MKLFPDLLDRWDKINAQLEELTERLHFDRREVNVGPPPGVGDRRHYPDQRVVTLIDAIRGKKPDDRR